MAPKQAKPLTKTREISLESTGTYEEEPNDERFRVNTAHTA